MTETPPGWYPDTSGSMRYWDGQQWIGQAVISGTPQMGLAPTGYPVQGYPATTGFQRQNPMAIWSLVTSFLGIACMVGSLAAVVLGVLSLTQIKSAGTFPDGRPVETGRGLAITGIVIGSLWIVGFVGLFVFGFWGL